MFMAEGMGLALGFMMLFTAALNAIDDNKR